MLGSFCGTSTVVFHLPFYDSIKTCFEHLVQSQLLCIQYPGVQSAYKTYQVFKTIFLTRLLNKEHNEKLRCYIVAPSTAAAFWKMRKRGNGIGGVRVIRIR